MSEREAPAVETRKTGRIDAVDCARGLALIGMAAYHLTWDLADFRLVSPLLPFSPPMRLLSHTVASAFLALVGVSLALAHRERLNLPAFSAAARDRRRWRGGAGDRRELVFVPRPDHLVRHPPLHRRGEPPRAAVCRGAGMDEPSRGRRGDRAALLRPFGAVRPAGAPLARPRRSLAEHSRLVPAPALGRRRPRRPWGRAAAWRSRPTDVSLALAREVRRDASGLASPGDTASRSISSTKPSFILSSGRSPPPGLSRPFLRRKPDYGAFLAACERACESRGRAAEDCELSCRCVADSVERSGEAARLGELDAERRAELRRMADACMGRRE